MDELEILKRDWNKPQSIQQTLSGKDIYPMLFKKSSSIVKTLFYISIAELVFWIFINIIPYFYSEAYKEKIDIMYSNTYVFTGLSIVTYGIILFFIYLLYKSYKSIYVTDNAKKLMESILKTRKIIKYYVLYNLIMAGLSLLVGFYYAFNNDPETIKIIQHLDSTGMAFMYVFIIVFTGVFILIIWLFYKLLYGFLLKRLNKNYNELKKLEV